MHAAMVAGLPISWRTGNPDGRTISAELADGRTVAAPGPSRHPDRRGIAAECIANIRPERRGHSCG